MRGRDYLARCSKCFAGVTRPNQNSAAVPRSAGARQTSHRSGPLSRDFLGRDIYAAPYARVRQDRLFAPVVHSHAAIARWEQYAIDSSARSTDASQVIAGVVQRVGRLAQAYDRWGWLGSWKQVRLFQRDSKHAACARRCPRDWLPQDPSLLRQAVFLRSMSGAF